MLELKLAGHITTDMQASCQKGDYVSLKSLNKQAGSSPVFLTQIPPADTPHDI